MKILDVIDVATTASIKLAWLHSRPKEDTEIEVAKILSIDLPVNEFGRISMFIESTTLEREFFSSFSGHVMWSQSSRVEDVTQFTYPEYMDANAVMKFEHIREDMLTLQLLGTRQEEFRTTMPIMSLCKYSINTSVRDLTKLRSLLREMEESGEYNHLNRWFVSFITGINQALEFMGVKDVRRKFKSAAILRSYNEQSADGIVGNTCVVTATVPFNLRTHIIRHRKINTRDNLLELMREKDFLLATHDHPVKVEKSGLVEDMTEVFSRRSCWIAHYALWSELLNKISEYIGLENDGLPCADGVCPFTQDSEARYIGTDPNPPCPIHANLYERSVSPEMIVRMRMQQITDLRPPFWLDAIDEVKIEG